MLRISVIPGLALTLCGCGTMENLARMDPQQPTVYGGVGIASARFNPNLEQDDWSDQPLMLPVYAADVVLSAIGDTITLPATIGLKFLQPSSDEPKERLTTTPKAWPTVWSSEGDDAPMPTSNSRTRTSPAPLPNR